MRNEKGYTGVSIAVSVVIIFIFVSLISMLIYNYNSTVREAQLRAKATEIAVTEIEKIKNMNFSDVKDLEENRIENKEIETEKGFFETVTLVDYADENSGAIRDKVKKVTVEISYKFKLKTQKVTLSSIISNPN